MYTDHPGLAADCVSKLTVSYRYACHSEQTYGQYNDVTSGATIVCLSGIVVSTW